MYECFNDVYADLHNHTTASDGEFSPAELVDIAEQSGLGAVAVTDHDTLNGLAEALEAGRRKSVRVVCGVEMTLRFKEPFFTGSLHLLLYFSDRPAQDAVFRSSLIRLMDRGRGPALTSARIAAINKAFAPGSFRPVLPRPLTESDLACYGDRVSRRHFALALEKMGISDREKIASIIGNDSPAYIPSGVPPEDVADTLSDLPVVRILAHPAAGSYPGNGHYKEVLPPYETVERLFPVFLRMKLDGLEICYPGHTHSWIEKLEAVRNRLRLPLYTGGSDAHDKQHRPPGVAGVSREAFEALASLMESRAERFFQYKEKEG